MIEVFELIMSAPMELKVIILAFLISPVFLLRKDYKKGVYEYHDDCYCDICKHTRSKNEYIKNR